MLGGLKIHTNPVLGDAWTDWSGCRSRSRAKRRARQGHPQRTIIRYKANGTCYRAGDVIYMHPDDARKLAAKLPPGVRKDLV